MATVKKTAKKAAPLQPIMAIVAAAQPQVLPTRCSGPEFDFGIVPLNQGDSVNLRVVLCQSAYRIRVHLDGKLIFDQSGLKDQFDRILPPLSPGFHSLTWGFLAASNPWHTRSEVQVTKPFPPDQALVQFALNKGSDSNIPSNSLSIILKVT